MTHCATSTSSSVATPVSAPSVTPPWFGFAKSMLLALEDTTGTGWRVTLPATAGEVHTVSAPIASCHIAQSPETVEVEPVSANPKASDEAPIHAQPLPSPTKEPLGITPDDGGVPYDQDEITAILAEIDAEEAAMLGRAVPDEEVSPPRTTWRAKPAVLLAVLRLAATFVSLEKMVAVLGAPGAITLIATGNSTLDAVICQVLLELVQDGSFWPRAMPHPKVVQAKEAIRKYDRESHRILAGLEDRIAEAVQRGTPIALTTPIAALAPRALRDLQPEVTRLIPLDREMLAILLDLAFPVHGADKGTGSGVTTRTNPGVVAREALSPNVEVARLTPDQITLALRATTPEEAVQSLAKALTPRTVEGSGWKAFPLSGRVRTYLGRVIDDLRAWQAGSISWGDIGLGPLLVGPPGSGKTQIARLMAQEAGIAVVAGSLSKWSSTSSRSSEMIKAMRADFTRAAEQAPCLLFIDELDGFGDRARRSDHNSAYTDYIVTALIDALDGFDRLEGVIVMGATNHVEKLDRAIIRAGRFDKILPLPYPDLALLPKAFRWHLREDLPGADLSEIAQSALGMSGADVAATVRAARGRARQLNRALRLEDLITEIAEIRPPLSEALRRIVAVHEAGHAIVGAATGRARVSMIAINADGGFTDTGLIRQGEDRALIDAQIAINMAGRAAERLTFGQVSAGAGGGPTSDLAVATRLAAALEASWGLGISPLWLGSAETTVAHLRGNTELRARVETHLRNAEARALRILYDNRALLEEVAAELGKAGVLQGEALDSLMARVEEEDGTGRLGDPKPPQ